MIPSWIPNFCRFRCKVLLSLVTFNTVIRSCDSMPWRAGDCQRGRSAAYDVSCCFLSLVGIANCRMGMLLGSMQHAYMICILGKIRNILKHPYHSMPHCCRSSFPDNENVTPEGQDKSPWALSFLSQLREISSPDVISHLDSPRLKWMTELLLKM